jgi:hypothetical protein
MSTREEWEEAEADAARLAALATHHLDLPPRVPNPESLRTSRSHLK